MDSPSTTRKLASVGTSPNAKALSDNVIVKCPTDPKTLNYVLECPVCTDFMTDTIRMCPEGHSMCGDCFTRLQTNRSRSCPSCRKSLVNSSGRNYGLETLAASCIYPCKFRDRGCAKVIEGHNFKIHLRECPFRDMKCGLFDLEISQLTCSVSLCGYKEYISHLVYAHNVPRISNGTGFKRSCTVNNGRISPTLVLIEFDRKTFFCNFQTLTLEDEVSYGCYIMCWIGIISENEDLVEHKNYSYRVSCEKDDNPENFFVLNSNDVLIDGKAVKGSPLPLTQWPLIPTTTVGVGSNYYVNGFFHQWRKMLNLSRVCFSQKKLEASNSPLEWFWKETITIWKSNNS